VNGSDSDQELRAGTVKQFGEVGDLTLTNKGGNSRLRVYSQGRCEPAASGSKQAFRIRRGLDDSALSFFHFFFKILSALLSIFFLSAALSLPAFSSCDARAFALRA
jgi:hypothetical protein